MCWHLCMEMGQESIDWPSWQWSIAKKWWKMLENGHFEKYEKNKQKSKNWRNAPTDRYFLSLVGVSRLCNLVDVARRWYMKVVLPKWGSRIPIWRFDRGWLSKNAKNRSKSDLLVSAEKIGVSQRHGGYATVIIFGTRATNLFSCVWQG